MALSISENIPIEVDGEHLKRIILELFGKSGYILDKCLIYDLLPFDTAKPWCYVVNCLLSDAYQF